MKTFLLIVLLWAAAIVVIIWLFRRIAQRNANR
jgi:hypothetical protein